MTIKNNGKTNTAVFTFQINIFHLPEVNTFCICTTSRWFDLLLCNICPATIISCSCIYVLLKYYKDWQSVGFFQIRHTWIFLVATHHWSSLSISSISQKFLFYVLLLLHNQHNYKLSFTCTRGVLISHSCLEMKSFQIITGHPLNKTYSWPNHISLRSVSFTKLQRMFFLKKVLHVFMDVVDISRFYWLLVFTRQ